MVLADLLQIHLCSCPGFFWLTGNSWPRVGSTNSCSETGKANWPTQDGSPDPGHLIIWKCSTSQVFDRVTHALPRGPGFKIPGTACFACLCVGKWRLPTPSPGEPTKEAAFPLELRDGPEASATAHREWPPPSALNPPE